MEKSSLDLTKRDTKTCSIGLGRQFASVYWDVTIFNTTQALRLDANIVATARNARMDVGESISLSWPPGAQSYTLKVTNLDNAPVLAYNLPDVKGDGRGFEMGATKVRLQFEVVAAEAGEGVGRKWTTDEGEGGCGASSVVFSGGREGWTCEFACP
ncbi:hypothetical protein MBM_08646 [Drepanopeziza brunnea f. sp. 'multigermtubi' MB_m1]|uniref:Uncharacterized protein n=1 Tax=Marssonina brunnea f. sp. multigermtubi (strain MB_m1) TaxID=1072389 RepID=K1WWZ4_MARBU|nr:uncharacterized protein MBM_08646 [Drepanopeziza brunnea f. sp. 'multigermtubi' MB_m1]EKD13203.1 hypothetical protein MBM_08646 [Drepanopeziza brunnea f. sp. 'multigermtubi' MB_m1]